MLSHKITSFFSRANEPISITKIGDYIEPTAQLCFGLWNKSDDPIWVDINRYMPNIYLGNGLFYGTTKQAYVLTHKKTGEVKTFRSTCRSISCLQVVPRTSENTFIHFMCDECKKAPSSQQMKRLYDSRQKDFQKYKGFKYEFTDRNESRCRDSAKELNNVTRQLGNSLRTITRLKGCDSNDDITLSSIIKNWRKLKELKSSKGEEFSIESNALVQMLRDFMKNQVRLDTFGNRNGFRYSDDTRKFVAIIGHLGGMSTQSILLGQLDMSKSTAKRVNQEYLPHFDGGNYNLIDFFDISI
jgi:hypothetical protein